ncbi:MAG: HD domain-containing protein [Syntrophomonadaceae bacterium]|nr:HD domain-containing protein [Syntrophomonadaceae bacterium]
MKRAERLINDPLYAENMELNVRSEVEPKSYQHDFRHHLDVARITYILILENNDLNYFVKESGLSSKLAAKEVIYAAGLLHDIGKWKEYTEGIDHALYGSRLAREILPRAFYNPREVDIICRAVYEHSNISRDMSFLGEKLHRADNLSRVYPEKEYFKELSGIKNKEINISSFEY